MNLNSIDRCDETNLCDVARDVHGARDGSRGWMGRTPARIGSIDRTLAGYGFPFGGYRLAFDGS